MHRPSENTGMTSSASVSDRFTLCWIIAPLLLLMGAGGCGHSPGIIFESTQTPLLWPAPPEQPRIQYVGQLASSADLKPGKSFGEGLRAMFFGEDDVNTMLTPYAVTSDGVSRVFVCDSNAQVVHVFDLDARVYERWQPNEDETFSQPVGVAYDNDRLFVADSVDAVVHVFNERGAYVGQIGEGLLQRPSGLAIDPMTGRLVVVDTAAHCLVLFGRDGTRLRTMGERGIGPGQFNYPTNIAIDEAGQLFVSDSLNFRVQVLDADFQFLRQIGEKGDLPGYFSQPKGIALDGQGHVYVVDAHFESVQIFDQEGRLLMTFGSEGTGRGQFWLPAGIHVDLHNRIWIADSYNRRVQVFDYLPEASQ